ncbi:MAG: TAXI family TRAP transporter solute-binding subunit [Syntrophaceae bacterium]|nr:TAXI family TRAP transporter solute-binding subunit [Syntrophaceae bacterium]
MKARIFLLTLVGLFLVSFIMGETASAQVKNYVFGSGPMGGPWRIGVGAGVQILNEQLKDKYSFTAAASGGSVENVRRMINGEYHTIWAHINNMDDAWNGAGLFEGQKPFKEMRVLEYLTDQAINVTTLAKSPIRNFSDLAGKKVNIGPAGSGGVPIAKAIFKALGITDKVKIVNIGFQAGAQALKDGQIDVSMIPGGPYISPAIAEISHSVTLRIVEPTLEEAKKVESEISYLYLGTIPANKSVGENADKEKRALFWSMYWVALASMPGDVVYDMLKVTQDPKNKEVLGKVLNYWLTAGPKFDTLVKMGIPLHPGAIRFWKEQGVKIPPEVVPK